MSSVSYDFLLDLYRGKATAVEQIDQEDLRAISIRTPLTKFLEDADSSGTPRHVVLTGNAGDGKTFAAKSANISEFEIVLDASQTYAGSTDPLDGLTAHLEDLLRARKRLLVAINRGQMDRLLTRLEDGIHPLTSEIMSAARDQLRLSVEDTAHHSEVAAIDLGLVDTLSDSILGALLDKVADLDVSDLPKGPTRIAVLAAQDALRNRTVRDQTIRVIRTSRLSTGHATMRQIWSLVAYLVTGGRDSGDSTPVTLADSVGARLFSASNRAALARDFRLRFDPALEPQPSLARSLLDDDWRQALQSLPGLGDLLSLSSEGESGLELVRAAAVHGSRDYKHASERSDTYEKVVQRVVRIGPGWRRDPKITTPLLDGIYRQLELGRSSGVFPAWTKLCFDATRIGKAASVAIANVLDAELRIAVPFPPKLAIKAFGDAWWAPYILLGFDGDDRHPLRLTPRMFRVLYDPSGAATPLTFAELLTLERWLAGVPVSQISEDTVSISASPGTFSVTRDPLDEKIYIQLRGEAHD